MKKIEVKEEKKAEVRKNVAAKKAAILQAAKESIDRKDVVAKVITKKKAPVKTKKDTKDTNKGKIGEVFSPRIPLPASLYKMSTKRELIPLYYSLKTANYYEEDKKAVRIVCLTTIPDREFKTPGNILNNCFFERLDISLDYISVEDGSIVIEFKKGGTPLLPLEKKTRKEFFQRLATGTAGRIILTGKAFGSPTIRKSKDLFLFDILNTKDPSLSGFIPSSDSLKTFVKSI